MKTFYKVICLLLALCLTAGAFSGCGKKPGEDPAGTTDPANRTAPDQTEPAAKALTVGILRYTNGAAATEAEQGVLKGLAAAGYTEDDGTLVLLREYAGSPAECPELAQKLAAEKPALLFAVGGPAAEALRDAAKEIPVVFTNVADPVRLGLVKTLNAPGANVTGVTDLPPAAEQIALLTALLPQAKTVAVVFSEGAPDSIAQYEAAAAALEAKGVACAKRTVTSISELSEAFKELKTTADAVFLPDDTTLGYSIVSVLAAATNNGLPTVGATAAAVNAGALAAKAVDHTALGAQAAALGLKLLTAEDPAAAAAATPVEPADAYVCYVNGTALETFGVTLPAELGENAVMLP